MTWLFHLERGGLSTVNGEFRCLHLFVLGLSCNSRRTLMILISYNLVNQHNIPDIFKDIGPKNIIVLY